MTKIDIQHLRKEFITKKETFVAVEDISFTLESGKVVALLGPNGAGKTTLVQMIAGYLEQTSGSILIDGTTLTKKTRKYFPMGVVLGGELGFYGHASARENLIFFAHLKKVARKQVQDEVNRVLTLVELKDVEHKKVREFSRGMKQRLHIARALLNKPKIILLDEPTTGLDVEIARTIREMIKHLAKTEKIAILLTSHTMSEIEFLSDRILLIGAGKIYHEGTVESIIRLSNLTKIDRPATLEESYLAIAEQLKRR
ncbi:ABC transporter ATP-binding protein [Carnobacteriaceae bacterium zg-ZUI78]|uniref:ABC transporter ATP-binding protein n=1 Tax=Granulicatella sp. zg-84 TaxID=2678503 RepID=UPI0013C0D8A5|nr:ABC transporter ATP-binding protein [Granulicatella sp. zg-84]MBS4749660.1 ABC transporter ATP-binding protein [Carnobacteriaceae bacterium zg-ZUI78]NEW66958.1 ATP-binding cassette domain-containing protein [Granulicatella sp. zg-84]QMI86443.1 ABC transporter ATP-binding protein [Carnobacteriaceae bacterium zg-84]